MPIRLQEMDRRQETGPFDIIGDLHGCADELEELLAQLGYTLTPMPEADPFWGAQSYTHPDGRKVIYVGDLVDRGPRSLDCLRIVRNMVESGTALCVPGNHDAKLVKKLRGKDVKVSFGLAQTLSEFQALPDEIRPQAEREVAEFLDGLVSHFVLDGGQLVVAHAGLREEYHGENTRAVHQLCLYGETTGEVDELGLPVRLNWAADYRGRAMVAYGHTPMLEAEWLNGTICLDTGCVFGGKLTALRYPERELVSVAAKREYFAPPRPLKATITGTYG
jgi:protein phosphatase